MAAGSSLILYFDSTTGSIVMVKKKGAKQLSKSAGKKRVSVGGKKKSAGPAKQAARKSTRRTATRTKQNARSRATLRTNHRQMRIGIPRNGTPPLPFHVGPDRANVFIVYGDSLGVGNPNRKSARPRGTNHKWQDAAMVRNAGRDALEITAVCSARIHTRQFGNGSDDLTVTITLDGVDETECTFTNVDYDA